MRKSNIINLILGIIIIVFIVIIFNLSNKSKKINNQIGTIVDVENFKRAESDLYIKKYFDIIGTTNTIFHYRNFDIDNSVIRMNLDTLYSIIILDLKNGLITVTIPDIKDRYMSMLVLDQDHYEVFFTNKGGEFTFNENEYTTSYLVCIFRIFVNNDIETVNNIQDGIIVDSKKQSDKLNIPTYNMKSYNNVKRIIKELFETTPKISANNMFGKQGEVNELKHLLGTYLGWGGLKEQYAYYESKFVEKNDGIVNYQINVSNVPVNAFWSIIVYDINGFIMNNFESKSLNNITAIPNKDNSYTINFTNDTTKINFINILDGWNYTVRMYEPQESILNGSWKFPEAIEV